MTDSTSGSVNINEGLVETPAELAFISPEMESPIRAFGATYEDATKAMLKLYISLVAEAAQNGGNSTTLEYHILSMVRLEKQMQELAHVQAQMERLERRVNQPSTVAADQDDFAPTNQKYDPFFVMSDEMAAPIKSFGKTFQEASDGMSAQYSNLIEDGQKKDVSPDILNNHSKNIGILKEAFWTLANVQTHLNHLESEIHPPVVTVLETAPS